MTAVPRTSIGDSSELSLALGETSVAFLHELTAAERAADVLSADGVLALWMATAEKGMPVGCQDRAADPPKPEPGNVRAVSFRDLPFGLPKLRSPGNGLIGQALVGPPGWLARFQPGTVLEIRVHDEALHVTAAGETRCHPGRVDRIMRVFGDAINAAVDGFACGCPDDRRRPAADIAEVLARLLVTEPELFGDPIPPLGPWLERLNLETYAGYIGLVGTPWHPAALNGLDRSAATIGMMALNALLVWDSSDTDHLRGLLSEIVATAGLVQYLADEIERRTASDGADFGPALGWLASTAATPAERAAVALFSARTAEGAADSSKAHELARQALADDPALVPALLDVGEYAANQGDLPLAADLLGRADHPRAATLLAAVRARLTAPAPTGKNRPCPCGSGRKAKLCCGTAALAPLNRRAVMVHALLTSYVQRPGSRNQVESLRCALGDESSMSMPFLLDLVTATPHATERFLRARGSWLRPDERELIDQWARTPLGWYEVRQVNAPESATLVPMPTGEPVALRERAFVTSARRLDLVLARLLTDSVRVRAFAVPVLVSRERRAEFVALRECDPDLDQIAAFLGPRPEPYLCNSDGHDYVDAEVTLRVPRGRPDDPTAAGELAEVAWRKLAKDLVPIRRDVLDFQVEREGRVLSLGTVTRKGWLWTLWGNSRERLGELERRVREVVPDAATVSRKAERIGGEGATSPRQRVPGRWVQRLTLDSHLIVATGGTTAPETAGTVGAARAAAMAWLDTPIEGLGATPRQAAASPEPRVSGELAAILDDLEWRNDRETELGHSAAVDTEWLRQRLAAVSRTG